MQDQLALGIRLLDEANFNSFYPGDNEELLCSLKSFIDATTWSYLYLSGSKSVGKSHLLQACCQHASNQNFSAFYLPLGDDFSINILEDLDILSLVCIDNIDYIAGIREWEEGLFHFFNRAMQNKKRLLIAGNSLPSHLDLTLPDLISRLGSGITYKVKPLSDSEKLAALQMRAQLRGFVLADEVGRYLLNHYPRDMSALFELLEILDKLSFQAQRRLTLPFVKAVLNEKQKLLF